MKIYYTALLVLLLLVTAGCAERPDGGDEMAIDTADQEGMAADTADQEGMGGMAMGEDYVPDSLARMNLAPLVKAYYEGTEMYFIHTEASDEQVAGMLTEMMGPDVVLVPELARAPDALIADIYVFKNGVQGQGPFGFQPDVFTSVPGKEGYSPLRRILQVTWNEDITPRELRAAGEVQEAARQGEITITDTDIVVNAPVLAWSDGHR